jgi:methylated-DNA-[protein]-cysteine S-methyltransferase
MSELAWTIYESPLGPLTVSGGPDGVRGVYFPRKGPRLDERLRRSLPQVTGQLDEYFAGERRAFELGLDLHGEPLQMLVWERLREIPYGETVSYGELAGRIGEDAFRGVEPHERARVVGAAVGKTPTPILVPCHRVIGADGSLTGYGGGLQRKQALLDLERRIATGRAPEPAWEERQIAML